MASQKSEHSRQPDRDTFWSDSLHIFVLVGFAVAQPLFDLLARNAEFFTFRQATWGDIVALVVILSVLLPLGLIGVEGIIGLFSHRLRRWIHGTIIAAGVAATVLPTLHPISALPGTLLVSGALLLGGIAALGYAFFLPVRQFFSLLSPAVLIFPALFAFASPVFRIVFPADSSIPVERVHITNPPPIIFIILDEFPLTALLNEHHQIDAPRYPNFAALAQHATWFRNATTVSDTTDKAVPAIVTGNYPHASLLPTAADHPHNIFTLLCGFYNCTVSGTITQLCPDQLCEKVSETLLVRVHSLLSDLSIVYLHLLLPKDLSMRLPSITQNWTDFAGNTMKAGKGRALLKKRIWAGLDMDMKGDRFGRFMKFVRGIDSAQQPTLHYLHTLLPHAPYNYLPSGKVYSTDTDIVGTSSHWEQWLDDEWAVRQNSQRHLLQVGTVDTLLGKLLTRLKALDLYDQSLIIVTADHGVSFKPNDFRRKLTKTNFQEIMLVPLLIKPPHQRKSVVSDWNVETVDILPTIADILGIRLPWPVDGHSVSARSPKQEKYFFSYANPQEKLVFYPTAFETKSAPVKRQLTRASSDSQSTQQFKLYPYHHLVGQRVDKIRVRGDTNVRIDIDRPGLFTQVDREAQFVPAHIKGRVYLEGQEVLLPHLAIAINGTIRAVTRPWTFPVKGERGHWSAVVDEKAFQTGQNTVEVFVVSDVAGQPTLSRATSGHYRLSGSPADQTEVLWLPDGSTISLVPQALRGWVNSAQVSENTVSLKGWAVDEKHAQPVERILTFLNGAFFHAGPTGISRPDIAKWLGQPFVSSGFQYRFPAAPFTGPETPEVRVFAVSGGIASELRYIEGYPWRRSVRR